MHGTQFQKRNSPALGGAIAHRPNGEKSDLPRERGESSIVWGMLRAMSHSNFIRSTPAVIWCPLGTRATRRHRIQGVRTATAAPIADEPPFRSARRHPEACERLRVGPKRHGR
jgi:hypothetical protein